MNKNHQLAFATSLLTMSSITFACSPVLILNVLVPASIDGCGQTFAAIETVYSDPGIESAVEPK